MSQVNGYQLILAAVAAHHIKCVSMKVAEIIS